jgi:pimeloyl-ACP methyl ester carboxylesterase
VTTGRVRPDDYGASDGQWLRIDWRRNLRRVELDGAAVNYIELGEGPPILFIHGISGCWQNWLENLLHLARSHRIIALDLPAFGASPSPSWEIDVPAYGRLMHELCEELEVCGGAALVGNSLGGFIALEAVTNEPDAFDHLVLVSTAGLINTWRPDERSAVVSAAWRAFGPTVAALAPEIVSRPRLRHLFWQRFVRYPDRLRPELLWEQMVGGLRGPGFTETLAAVIRYDVRDRLAAIETPTLIVWGSDDHVIPVRAGHSFNRRIPGSRLVIFERTGHVPQLERPGRFNALLEEFLSE